MKAINNLAVLILVGILTTSACGQATGNVYRSVEDQSLSGADFDYEMAEAPPAEHAVNVSTEAALTERIVIRNAQLTLVVSDPAETAKKIGAMAEEMGGFVVTSNVYKTTFNGEIEGERASVMIRVPSERLDEALDNIKAEAIEVRNDFVSGQDVTEEYTDLQSQLRHLEAVEEQLLEFLDEARSTEDALDVFEQLEKKQSEIEIIKGRLQYLEDSARLSEISVELEPDISDRELRIGPWKPVGTAKSAVEALLKTLKFIGDFLIIFVIYILPTALILGAIVWAVLKVYRRFRPKKAKEPAAEK